MCLEEAIGTLCFILAIVYFLVYEINWPAVKELIFRKAK